MDVDTLLNFLLVLFFVLLGGVFAPNHKGMPIIAADPSVDPKFVITIPESERREAKIRTAEPPKCEPVTLVPAKKR